MSPLQVIVLSESVGGTMRSILGSVAFCLCVLWLTPKEAPGQAPGGMTSGSGMTMGGGYGGMAGGMAGGEGSMAGGAMGGYGGGGVMVLPPLVLSSPVNVTHADGTNSEVTFTHNYAYYIAPGMAKPNRITSSKVPRLSQGRSTDSYNKIAPDSTPHLLKLIGPQHIQSAVPLISGRVIFALVNEQTAADEPVLVFQQKSPAGEMAAGGIGMEGMAGEGGMTGMSSGMMGSMGSETIVLSTLEVAKNFTLGAKNESLATEDLKILADLIRLDIKIEHGLTELSAQRQDADKFREAEAKLRTLLAREYQAQLARQRSDVARMNAKLKLLQEELQRREAATDRVVEVQLGKLVLEAQGLIGDRSTEGF